MKSYLKKQDDKKDKKKVKFITPPTTGSPHDKDKQVNVVQATGNMSNNESENEGSEIPLPDETLISLEDSTRAKYFDLRSSSSKEYDSNSNSEDEE